MQGGGKGMPMLTESIIHINQEDEKLLKTLAEFQQINKKKFWRIKRIIDICISLLAIILFLIPMGLITIMIFFTMPRKNPVFCQERIGRGGKPFCLYKFRTMIPNAENLKEDLLHKNEMDGPVFKIKDDPRITKFGRVLRKTSLDELLQFINVIKGDMTVVGPRPPLPKEVEQYTEYQKLRLSVTPGITGLWQIQPNRNDMAFDEWVELDIEYILNRSVAMDIKIMLTTALVMLKGEGR